MFCAPARHYRVLPTPPHVIPQRNDFSFLKDNSCSKCSSRCSWVSQNKICRSEQEAFIIFFDVPSRQPFFGWKSHFTILTDCLAGVSLEEPYSSISAPKLPRFIWGHQVDRDICVQTTDSVVFHLWTPGYKLQPSPQVKIIISTKSFTVYITTPLQSLANSEALMRSSSQETWRD